MKEKDLFEYWRFIEKHPKVHWSYSNVFENPFSDEAVNANKFLNELIKQKEIPSIKEWKEGQYIDIEDWKKKKSWDNSKRLSISIQIKDLIEILNK